MLTFRLQYFICAFIIFIIEVLIALFVEDKIVRPYIGDILVVILIYSFLRAFLQLPVMTVAIITLLFAYLIETLQYFNIVEVLGLDQWKIARTILGTSFSWIDVLCYTIGFGIILLFEQLRAQNK